MFQESKLIDHILINLGVFGGNPIICGMRITGLLTIPEMATVAFVMLFCDQWAQTAGD